MTQENKINIAELLKDCPKGTKLYSPLCGECKLDKVVPEKGTIVVETSRYTCITFNHDGTFYEIDDSECLLFPSKEKRDWSKFQRPFKDGDVLMSGVEDGMNNPFIFKEINGLGNAKCYCAINCFKELIFNSDNWTSIKGCRLATEEEKQKLFDAIKEHGYKWNEETKTLEKLPKFKVGDRIKMKGIDDVYAMEITEVTQTIYTFKNGGQWGIESVDKEYELVHNKFDITTLKPFESKVLVRDINTDKWIGAFYSHYKSNGKKFYTIGSSYYYQCIPYEGNEHLLDTTDECDEFYKTWK